MLDPISQEDFSLLVANAICKTGVDAKSVHIDLNDFAIRHKDEQGKVIFTIFLANMFANFNAVDCEEQRTEILERSVKLWLEPTDTPPFTEAKSRILPVVRPRLVYPENPAKEGDLSYPQVVIGNHLTTLLAVDLDDFIRPLSSQDYEEWDITWDEALDAASDNMQSRANVKWEVYESEDNPEDCLYLHESQDDYGSSLLAFPQMICELKVLGERIIFTPTKNSIIVTGSQSQFGLQKALDIVEMCETRQDALVPEMLSVDDEHCYFACDLPEEHELYDKFSKLKLVNEMNIYLQFVEDYQGNFEQLINPRRIAEYEVFEQDGYYFSEMTIGLDEAPVIIPCTQYICLESDEELMQVSTGDFAEVAGEKLKLINEYPALYELTEPLSKEELEELKNLDAQSEI